jgi:REP element-mobilizing transposase RayT
MPYWRLYYHAVWACKNREPLITAALEPELHKYLRSKGLELGASMYAVGGIEDHVHSSFALPPKFAVAEFIGKLKGARSHWVTHVLGHPGEFDWQRGYGVLSFGSRDLARVVAYVNNQKEHHRCQTTLAGMEKWSEEEDGVMMYLDSAS